MMRGVGETQLETDRRIILTKIAFLKEELKGIDKQMASQRKNRGKMVRAALVGYTNIGKINPYDAAKQIGSFCGKQTFCNIGYDSRKVIIDNLPFLLSDTVGFIPLIAYSSGRII